MPGSRTSHWFEAMAEHMGAAYLRYSFTRGTEQEADFLVAALELGPGSLVLDVGCGPGRHAHALARRGARVVGVDIAERFTRLAAAGAGPGETFLRGDVRLLPLAAGAVDAAVCLCQGGFGLLGGGPDELAVLREIARVLRPGGVAAVSAFSAYFAVRHLEEGEVFDPSTGVVHERTSIRSETGEAADFDLFTTCFTPRELRLAAEAAGLEVRAVWSVTPGAYQAGRPDLDHPEFLLVAARPG